MDIILARQCHGFELPIGLTQSMINEIWEAANYQANIAYNDPTIGRLG